MTREGIKDGESRMARIEEQMKNVREEIYNLRDDVRTLAAKFDTFIAAVHDQYVTRSEIEQLERRWHATKWRDQLMTGLVATTLATLAGYFIRDILGR